MKQFRDYKDDAPNQITMANGAFYPDILEQACVLYKPVLVYFGQLLKVSPSSEALLREITTLKETWMRIQLLRVFRKYVSPDTSVEMLKSKNKIPMVCSVFGKDFRSITTVQRKFNQRPIPDEALCALLWEYKDRGQKGYSLTETFFEMFRVKFPEFSIDGPQRAGSDIQLSKVFSDYPNPNRPVDFVIRNKDGKVLAIGLARYDSDRGGAQEDDRTGGYQNCAKEILGYADQSKRDLKIIFLNDGPGLLLGSMWDDYSRLEQISPTRIMVLTLRMLNERLTEEWLNT